MYGLDSCPTLFRRVAMAMVVALVAAGSAAAQEYGTIKGRLIWGGDDVPKLAPAVTKGDPNVKDPFCAGHMVENQRLVVDPESKGVKYAFVYLVQPKGENAELVSKLLDEHPEAEMDQIDCQFVPHALAIHEDQTLIFKSSDPTGHNVRYAGFTNPAQNIQLPPKGELQANLVAERRAIPVSCDIHPWMKAWVMVFDHPFFAVTDEEGNFEIKGVPAGEQNLIVWHEEAGYVTPGAARGFPVQVQGGMVSNLSPLKLDPVKVKLDTATGR